MKSIYQEKSIHFGTDGWRAIIYYDFNLENVRKVSQAISDHINSLKSKSGSRKDAPLGYGKRRVIVGYDRRFLSDTYAKVVSEVLAGNNIHVLLTHDAVPTPSVTFAIKKRRLDAGIIITASHNPFLFNGIKFKTRIAASADEATTSAIEKLIGKNKVKATDFSSALRAGAIENVDISTDYIKFLRSYIDLNSIKKARPRVLVDYMHGTGSGYIETILGPGASRFEFVRTDRDPFFGKVNPEPIPKNLKYPIRHIKTGRFDLGVALDGDADRIGGLRPDGRYLTCGQITSMILLHFIQDRRLSGSVVKTISGTTLLDRICRQYDLRLFETPIGFKHISELMLKEDILIGGEESGGIGFRGYIPERDGILSALLLIEMVAQQGRSITSIMDEIDNRFGRFNYDRVDLEYPKDKVEELLKRLKQTPPIRIAGKNIVNMKTYDGIKFIMEDSSWLLLRFSGTEPLIRIYAEAHSVKDVKGLLEAGIDVIVNRRNF